MSNEPITVTKGYLDQIQAEAEESKILDFFETVTCEPKDLPTQVSAKYQKYLKFLPEIHVEIRPGYVVLREQRFAELLTEIEDLKHNLSIADRTIVELKQDLECAECQIEGG